MAKFPKFNRKRRPHDDECMRAWNARVEPTISPERLAPGQTATHSVDMHNLDEIYRYEVTISAKCLGRHLRYGTNDHWRPGTMFCDPGTSVTPIAFADVGVPGGADVTSGTEQIDMEITLVRADPQRKPVTRKRVFTLRLDP